MKSDNFLSKGNHGTNLKKHFKTHNKLHEEYLIDELSKSNAKDSPVPTKNAMDLYQIPTCIHKLIFNISE